VALLEVIGTEQKEFGTSENITIIVKPEYLSSNYSVSI